jgi:DNA polymerase I-like protein with 3'-5' exonuclease and polymerase domains/uracil-DNA glycosylase
MFWGDIKEDAASKSHRKVAKHIPIETMHKMGCDACARDPAAVKGSVLANKTPKMAPDGPADASVYLLALQPTEKDDDRGESFSSGEAREIVSKLSAKLFKRTRTGYIAQCHWHEKPDESVLACCRGRVVPDIEATKPLIVVTIGDEALKWATGMDGGTIPFRGSLIATKFGNHSCWVYPIIEPKYIQSKRFGKSEFEAAVDHDCQALHDLIFDSELKPPHIEEPPYDKGIEYITGSEPGDMVRLEVALSRMLKLPRIGVDIETSSIDPYMDRNPLILTIAIGTFDDVVVFPVEHPQGWGTETRMRRVLDMVGEFIYESGEKVCHNTAFEQTWIAFKFGSYLLRRTRWADTMAAAYSFDERQGTKSLDVQCRKVFGFFLKAQSRVDVSTPNWWMVYSLKEILRYNALDTKWTHKLMAHFDLAFLFDGRAHAIYERKVRLSPTLVMTAEAGLPIDFQYAQDVLTEIRAKRDDVEHKLRQTIEVREFTQKFGTFAPGNNDHALKLFRDVLKRPECLVTDAYGRESYSVKEEVLSSMPASVKSAQLTLDYRQLDRNETTYLGPLLDGKLTGSDDIWHTTYSSMDTATSRLNSAAHNWPKHKFSEVRGAVCAPDGHWFVACDEGQIEFRVCMAMSEDERGIEYCWTGYDCHGYWAQRMLDEYPAIVDAMIDEYKLTGDEWEQKGKKTLRQHTKNGWVFPMLFGSKAKGCATRMHIPVDVAERLAEEFWDEFKGVKRWQERLIKGYQKNLYVETMGGFRRHGAMTENELINMPIQGSTAELVLDCMCELSEQSDAEDRPALQPRFNGHDDLSFIVPDRELESVIDDVSMTMCKPRYDWINVPLIVEVSIGERWNKLKEIAKYSSADLYGLPNPYGKKALT